VSKAVFPQGMKKLMRKIIKFSMIDKMYNEIKVSFLGPAITIVPEKYRSNFVNLGGAYEANYIIWRLLEKGGAREGKVLVAGFFGGRDYFGLLLRGYEVYGFDLVEYPEIERCETGNIEEDLPYPDEAFDAVIMGEVLEHLKYDANALKNVRRVLKMDGLLIVSVPFLHDKTECHIRVHTRLSCKRLLEACGFEVLSIVERPAIYDIPFWMNWIHHLAGWVSLKIFKALPHKVILPLWSKIEFNIGLIYNPLRHLSRSHGGYYLSRKLPTGTFDYLSANREEFGDK